MSDADVSHLTRMVNAEAETRQAPSWELVRTLLAAAGTAQTTRDIGDHQMEVESIGEAFGVVTRCAACHQSWPCAVASGLDGERAAAERWASTAVTLRQENDELRETIEARDEALMRAGRDNLRLHGVVAKAREAVTAQILTKDELNALVREGQSVDYLNGRDAGFEAALDLLDDALDGAPDPRRIETGEELDALPEGAILRDREGDAWQKDDGGQLMCAGIQATDDAWRESYLPMTVLWTPEVSP